ncbi:GIY-YIG nuclease family protein [Fusibacter bizertensis]
MEKNEKKKRIEAYKNTFHPMGVFCIIKKVPVENDPRVYVQTAINFMANFNSAKMKLNSNFHPYKELQSDWNTYGEEAFDIKILEELAYSDEVPNADYSEELEILKMLWEDKFRADGIRPYEKRLNK